MSPQYRVAKQCLHLLSEISAPSIKKLRLEILFIHLLRLLLQEDLTGSETGICSTEEFAALHRLMLLIKEQRSGSDAIHQVLERVGEILIVLDSRAGGNETGTASASL